MRVFVTGASGFIGSAIVPELLQAGHTVLGLARSDASAAALTAAGADVQRGSLEDLDSLRAGIAATDGVIHTAFIHDFSQFEKNVAIDRQAIEVMLDALAGSNKPFVATFGILSIPADKPGTENEPGSAQGAGGRGGTETLLLEGAARGIRTTILRLPPSVHDKGDHGFVPALIGIARAKGQSAYIGDGSSRWPAVHRLDAAVLYRLALEQAAAGSRLHAIGDEGVPTRDIAEVIGRHLNLPVVSISQAEAPAHFGFLAHFLGTDRPATAHQTQAQLGWTPTHPGLLADLEQGHYFES